MKSLFLRIFLWFCGTTGVIVFVITAGFALDFPEALATSWRNVGQGALLNIARTATTIYERGGKEELARYFQSVARDTGLQANLFDAANSSAPDAIAEAMANHPEGQLTVLPRKRLAAVRLRGESGATYVFTTALPPREPGLWGRRFLGLVVVIGGLFCFLLARHVTAPVVALRTATAKFSSGDLGARIDSARVLGRKDEIGGLARDFNHMAERIETLMKAQQRLIADVSHELRSPITRLGLALGLLRRRSEADPRPSLARMERELERLNTLIAQLLTLSRLEGTHQPPPMEPIDLAALVREIAADADFEATSMDRGVRLLECASCEVDGARDLLRSAIENVVRNALRYTPPNSQVVISLHANAGDGATISVEDQGPGAPESALEHLFEPFYRVDEARDRTSGGAGLGLAIAHRVVKVHGGAIRAANRTAGGLELRITLPVRNTV